jgi:single stranded DNA-binding protein
VAASWKNRKKGYVSISSYVELRLFFSGAPQNVPEEQARFHIINRLTLIGFIGGDAETKTISNGATFTAFAVATQRSWKNVEGVWESRTEWHHCVSFGTSADFAATLKKGAHVQVEGEPRGREYEKDGVKHKVLGAVSNRS